MLNPDVLKRLDLITVLPKRRFDPDDMDDPLTTVGSVDQWFSIDYRQKKSVRMVLNKVELYDDKYDFF